MEMEEILVNSDLMELTPHKTPDLPMKIYTDDYSKYILKYVNWHWHNEFEFVVMLRGTARFLMEEETRTIGEGEGIFINSRVLHQVEPVGRPEDTLDFSVLVSPGFIASSDQGNLYDKYVGSVVSNAELECLALGGDTPWQSQALELLKQMYALDGEKPFGYELEFHSSLFTVWKMMVMNAVVCAPPQAISGKRQVGRERINGMLDFVKAHYSEDITVRDIARSVSISKSECFRCFQASIGVNPHAFLQRYRVERAAVLLCTTGDSVSRIAASCGFNSPSYFGSVFRENMGVTPLTYRRRHGGPGEKDSGISR